VRRALVIVMSALLIGFGMWAWAAPSHASPDSARGKADTKSATVNLEFIRRTTQFPAGDQTSYYCAVGVFVPFGDIDGYEPSEAAWLHSFGGGTPGPESMTLTAPYSDTARIDIPQSGGASLDFTAAPGTHHQQIGGYTYSQGPFPNDCQDILDRYVGSYSKTATVTYVRSEACQAAAEKLEKAQKAYAKARNALQGTHGAAHAAALAKLEKAKAKLDKAKKKYKKACK
jgi:hypothetical protein